MEEKLIKISEEHYIIVNDSTIQRGDFIYESDQNNINEASSTYVGNSNDFKITHSTQPLNKNFNDWFDVKMISLAEVEEAICGYNVEKMAEKRFKTFENEEYQQIVENQKNRRFGYVEGFNAHKELVKDKLFTEFNIENALFNLWRHFVNNPKDVGLFVPEDVKEFSKKFIQSLLPPTEWDVTFDEQGKLKLIK